MNTTVRAAVLGAPGDIRVREFPLPEVGADLAIMDVEVCGVCGTDRQLLLGDEPAPYPLVLGHEGVGRIRAIGAAAAARYRVDVGDRVIVEPSIPCWECAWCFAGDYRLCPHKGGYGQRMSLSRSPGLWGAMADVMYIAPGSIVHRVPDGISATAGVGAQILANSVQWLQRKGGLRAGQHVLISGCGPQGLIAAIFARVAGAASVTVTGLQRDGARLDYASRTGASVAVVGENGEHLGTDYDLVLEVSGSPSAISDAVFRVRAGGTLVLAGRAGRGRTVPIDTDLVWKREITVRGVVAKDAQAVESALRIVANDARVAAELEDLTTHTFPLDRVEEAIRAADLGLDGFVKAAVVLK